MGHARLVHRGYYSVLDTNVAASLLQRAAPLLSRRAVQRGPVRPAHVPHSL